MGRIEEIQKEINELLEDISACEKAIEDRRIDYVSKREYQNDIIYDKRRIDELRSILIDLEEQPKVLIKENKR